MAVLLHGRETDTGEKVLVPFPTTGGGEAYVTASDFTDSTGAVSNVPGMSFSVAAGEEVTALIHGFWETNTNNYGSRIAFTGPSSPAVVTYSLFQFTTVQAVRTLSGATAFGTELFETNGSAIGLLPVVAIFHMVNGSNPGTVQFRAGSEASGFTYRLRRGLTMQVIRF